MIKSSTRINGTWFYSALKIFPDEWFETKNKLNLSIKSVIEKEKKITFICRVLFIVSVKNTHNKYNHAQ